jgi:hypothetical protein
VVHHRQHAHPEQRATRERQPVQPGSPGEAKDERCREGRGEEQEVGEAVGASLFGAARCALRCSALRASRVAFRPVGPAGLGLRVAGHGERIIIQRTPRLGPPKIGGRKADVEERSAQRGASKSDGRQAIRPNVVAPRGDLSPSCNPPIL